MVRDAAVRRPDEVIKVDTRSGEYVSRKMICRLSGESRDPASLLSPFCHEDQSRRVPAFCRNDGKSIRGKNIQRESSHHRSRLGGAGGNARRGPRDHAVAVSGGEILAVLPPPGARATDARETVAPGRRAGPRAGQRPLPQPDDAVARRRRRPAAGVAAAHRPIEAAVIGPDFVADGVTWSVAGCCAAAPPAATRTISSPTCRAATYRRHGFRAPGRPTGDRFPRRRGRADDEYFDRAATCTTRWRGDALVGTAFARMRHTRSATPISSASACCRTSSRHPGPTCLHETAREVRQSVEQHGQRRSARVDRLGLFSDHLIAVPHDQAQRRQRSSVRRA